MATKISLLTKYNSCQFSNIWKFQLRSTNINNLAKTIHTTSVLLNEHVINIQDKKNFDEIVLSNKTPVIVDFFATWCGPCKLLAPRLELIVANKKGSVILAKIDIDNLDELAAEYKVTAVPTIIGMKNGKIIDKFVGSKDDTDLETFINNLIK